MIKLKYFIQVSFIVAMLNLSLVPIFPRMAAFLGYIMIVSFWFYAFVGSFTNRHTKRIIIPLFIIIIISAIISFHNFCDEELRQKLIQLFLLLRITLHFLSRIMLTIGGALNLRSFSVSQQL